MVVGLRPPPRATFPDGNRTARIQPTCQLNDLREPVEDTLCPSGTACPACVKRLRTHRVRGAIWWRGQALRFAPLPLCLSRRASDETDPAIPSALDGLKYFRLSRGSRLATAPERKAEPAVIPQCNIPRMPERSRTDPEASTVDFPAYQISGPDLFHYGAEGPSDRGRCCRGGRCVRTFEPMACKKS